MKGSRPQASETTTRPSTSWQILALVCFFVADISKRYLMADLQLCPLPWSKVLSLGLDFFMGF